LYQFHYVVYPQGKAKQKVKLNKRDKRTLQRYKRKVCSFLSSPDLPLWFRVLLVVHPAITPAAT